MENGTESTENNANGNDTSKNVGDENEETSIASGEEEVENDEEGDETGLNDAIDEDEQNKEVDVPDDEAALDNSTGEALEDNIGADENVDEDDEKEASSIDSGEDNENDEEEGEAGLNDVIDEDEESEDVDVDDYELQSFGDWDGDWDGPGVELDDDPWGDDNNYNFEGNDVENNEAIPSNNVQDPGENNAGGSEESAIGCWDCDESSSAGPIIFALIILAALFIFWKKRPSSDAQRIGYRPVPAAARTKLHTK